VLFDVKKAGVSPVSVVFDPLNGDGLLDSSLSDITDVGTSAGTVTIEPRVAPEPVTMLLVVIGFGGLLARRASTPLIDSRYPHRLE
jgi:hypothetical protein